VIYTIDAVVELGAPSEEDHPRLTLLNYLADVASVTDHLPQADTPPEEMLSYGTIEDILTAAALAESVKEEIEIFSNPSKEEVEGMNLAEEENEEEVEVNIMTVEDEDCGTVTEVQIHELMQESTQCIAPEEQIQEKAIEETTVGEAVDQPMEGSAEREVSNMEEDAIPQRPLDTNEMHITDNDLESLISFSEADDTIDVGKMDRSIASIPTKEATIDGTVEFAAEEIPVSLDERLTPNASVGVNEMGEFVAPDINIFVDPVSIQENKPQSETVRLSMDTNVIFKFSLDQDIIKSPPKRQTSALAQQDDV
jgi:hypothetical protein